jgi:hypothetical protein
LKARAYLVGDLVILSAVGVLFDGGMQRTAPLITLEAIFSKLSPADVTSKKGWRAGVVMAERMREMKLIINYIFDSAVTENITASEMVLAAASGHV